MFAWLLQGLLKLISYDRLWICCTVSKPGTSPEFRFFLNLTTIHPVTQARSLEHSLNTTPFFVAHVLITSQIYPLLSVSPTTTLVDSHHLSSLGRLMVCWWVSPHRLYPILHRSPHCSSSDLFEMPRRLLTPWLKPVGGFSLLMREKTNSLNGNTKPWMIWFLLSSYTALYTHYSPLAFHVFIQLNFELLQLNRLLPTSRPVTLFSTCNSLLPPFLCS